MSLEADLHAVMLAALSAAPGVAAIASGVHPAAPKDAGLPWLALGPIGSVDWSAKGITGRELRLTLNATDAGQSPSRLYDLAEAALGVLATLPSRIGEWQLGPFVHLRTLSRRSGPTGWAADIELRVRAMRIS